MGGCGVGVWVGGLGGEVFGEDEVGVEGELVGGVGHLGFGLYLNGGFWGGGEGICFIIL